MARRRPDDDDGFVVADMSALRGEVDDLPRSVRDVSNELQDSRERLMVVLGTLRAALSLWMVYVVVIGLVIALMVMAWT